MIRIGFAKTDITPPLGIPLGGYAGYRPCTQAHDRLYCKAILLEQDGVRYALVSMDLMCVDESLYQSIARQVAGLGIEAHRLIACAIHSHAAPQGMIPEEGPLALVNSIGEPKDSPYGRYMQAVSAAAAEALGLAAENLEPFVIRTAQGPIPKVGSERHTGGELQGNMTVIQCRTESGRLLTVYNFPCHPTVLSAANLQPSADFAAGIETLLGGDMAVFLNGAAGDISTRYTRQEATFEECARMGRLAAEQIKKVIDPAEFREPEPLRGIHTTVTLHARQVDTPEVAQAQLAEFTAQWKAAEAAGEDPTALRIRKSYVEGAGVNLEFAHTMQGIRQLCLPVTVFRFGGLDFASVPGELFSTLQPEGISVISYANGYYRYFAGEDAYAAGYYEAMAAIIRRGEGETLREQIQQLHRQLDGK